MIYLLTCLDAMVVLQTQIRIWRTSGNTKGWKNGVLRLIGIALASTGQKEWYEARSYEITAKMRDIKNRTKFLSA